MDAAADATDDARGILEPESFPPEGGSEGEDVGVGDDESFLHPQSWPGDFLAAFFKVFFGMTVMLILQCLVRV